MPSPRLQGTFISALGDKNGWKNEYPAEDHPLIVIQGTSVSAFFRPFQSPDFIQSGVKVVAVVTGGPGVDVTPYTLMNHRRKVW